MNVAKPIHIIKYKTNYLYLLNCIFRFLYLFPIRFYFDDTDFSEMLVSHNDYYFPRRLCRMATCAFPCHVYLPHRIRQGNCRKKPRSRASPDACFTVLIICLTKLHPKLICFQHSLLPNWIYNAMEHHRVHIQPGCYEYNSAFREWTYCCKVI